MIKWKVYYLEKFVIIIKLITFFNAITNTKAVIEVITAFSLSTTYIYLYVL